MLKPGVDYPVAKTSCPKKFAGVTSLTAAQIKTLKVLISRQLFIDEDKPSEIVGVFNRYKLPSGWFVFEQLLPGVEEESPQPPQPRPKKAPRRRSSNPDCSVLGVLAMFRRKLLPFNRKFR